MLASLRYLGPEGYGDDELPTRVSKVLEELILTTSQELDITSPMFWCQELRPINDTLWTHQLQLPIDVDVDEFEERLRAMASNFRHIFAVYGLGDNAISLGIGFDCAKATHLGLGEGSRAYSILNQPPMLSDQRPQCVRLCLSHDACQVPDPRLIDGPDAVMLSWDYEACVQEMITFLKMTLRLSAADLAMVRDDLWFRESEWGRWPYDLPLTLLDGVTSFQTFEWEVQEALIHPVRHGYGAQLLAALKDNTMLANFSCVSDWNESNRKLRGSWLVFITGGDRLFCAAATLLAPSFFMEWENVTVNRQVHIMDYKCMTRRVMLLSFPQRPTEDQVESALAELSEEMRTHSLLDSVRSALRFPWTITQPWCYDFTTPRCVFRADGLTSLKFVQQISSKLTRSQLAQAGRLTDTDWNISTSLLTSSSKLSIEAAPERTRFIFWIRTSHTDKSTGSYTRPIEHQLWIILSQFPNDLQPIHAEDRFNIIIERCSSIRHSWDERQIKNNVARLIRKDSTRQPIIITAWADRLTRRKEDVDTISDWLDEQDATWIFRERRIPEDDAFSEDGDDDDDDDDDLEDQSSPSDNSICSEDMNDQVVADWADSADPTVQAQLRLNLVGSMAIGLESSTYARNRVMLKRIIAAAKHDEAVCLNALRRMFAALFERQHIERVLIFTRMSPRPTSRKSLPKWECSIEYQLGALDAVLPPGIQIEYSNQVGVSAFTRAHEEQLLQQLGPEKPSTCLITTSIDRAVRNPATLQDFRSILTTNGHIALSLLWDWRSDMGAADALGGILQPTELVDWQQALKTTRPFATASLHHLALLQPMIWAGIPVHVSTEHHILRHVSNATDFCKSRSTPVSSGKTSLAPLPKELIVEECHSRGNRYTKLCLSPQTVERWVKSFEKKGLTLDSVEEELDRSQWKCNCQIKQACTGYCVCNCVFCAAAVACPCSAMECVCEELRSCNCNHCHAKGAKKHAQKVESTKPQYGICNHINGCDKETSGKRKMCSKHYNEYLANRALGMPCGNPKCDKPKTQFMDFCSMQCYIKRTSVPRKCVGRLPGYGRGVNGQGRGPPGACHNVVPPGYMTICLAHSNTMPQFKKLVKEYRSAQSLAQ